jgi:hypothetical protein
MPIKRYASLALSLLAFVQAPVSAHESEAYPFYGGFGLGFSAADSDCDYHGYDCDGNDTSFKIFAGKRLHENLAFEISFQDFGKLDNNRLNLTTTAESSGVNLSLLGIIPIENVGFFYGKIGVIASETDYTRFDSANNITNSDDDDTGLSFGGGFAFTFKEKYDVRIEFERLNELNDEFTPGGAYITVLFVGGTIYFQ